MEFKDGIYCGALRSETELLLGDGVVYLEDRFEAVVEVFSRIFPMIGPIVDCHFIKVYFGLRMYKVHFCSLKKHTLTFCLCKSDLPLPDVTVIVSGR
jgi:hypothetical protein